MFDRSILAPLGVYFMPYIKLKYIFLVLGSFHKYKKFRDFCVNIEKFILGAKRSDRILLVIFYVTFVIILIYLKLNFTF